jgi:hypothetical protein
LLGELTYTDKSGTVQSLADRGISYGWLMLVLVARDVLLLVLAGLVVREMWCPWLDVVRVDGADDPGGGVFDGAEDFFAREPVDDADLLDVHATDELDQMDARR